MRTHILEIETRERTEFLPLSRRIAREASAILEGSGALVVYVPHSTAGVCINEGADPDVMGDLARVLDRLAPWKADYRHAEGNAAAHVKAALVGISVTVPVRDSKLRLGRWQEIFFCEFDGPRGRSVELQFLPG
jgi:secondary thiamine-phosphate synthase enzyme